VRAVRRLSVPLACLGALLWVGPASAEIVPQQSIAKIELGMTRPEVRAVRGDPRSVEHGTNEFGQYTVFRYWKLRVTFQGNAGATAVFTTRRRQVTSKGIGVGSTVTEIKTAYPNARCRKEAPNFRHCWTGRFQPGRRVTDYRIDIPTHRVESVLVGFVID
jgi:hypothetical protein